MTRRKSGHRPILTLSICLLAGTAAEAGEPTPGTTPEAHHHPHGAGTEIPEDVPVPRIELEVLPDSVSGWNVYADVSDFTFAPENASRTPVSGEGHAHLYVDGRKVARVYGRTYHLTGLEPGRHTITYSLNANDHSPYTSRGREIAASSVVQVAAVDAEHAGHHHALAEIELPDGTPVPQVRLQVTPDPKSGWNVHVELQEFELTAETVGGEPVVGRGHGHLYVDGEKVARLYTRSFHLGALDPGTHEIKLTLHADNHVPFTRGGEVVGTAVTVEAPQR